MLLKNPFSSLFADSFVGLVSVSLLALLLSLAVALAELVVTFCVEVVDIDVGVDDRFVADIAVADIAI